MNLFGLSSKLKQLILPFAKQYIRSQITFLICFLSVIHALEDRQMHKKNILIIFNDKLINQYYIQ